MKNKRRQGFTLAEALITLVIMGLVLAATMPIVRTASNQPAEAPWKYIVRGNLINNNAVYTAAENNSLAVAGDNKIPYDDGIREGDLPTIFASQINPKIAIVTQGAKDSNPVISRHLLDFYEKSGTNKHKSIGKISFDRNFNLAIGTNALDTTARQATANVTNPDDTNGWYKLGASAKGAANTAVGQYAMGGASKLIEKDTSGSYRLLEGNENSSLGAFSMQHLTTGSYNVALGSYSMQFSKTSDANVAIGSSSMGNTEGTGNVAIGVNSLLGNKTVNEGSTLGKVQGNVAIGYNALYSAHNEYSGSTTNTDGSYNISIGANTMAKITSGKDNVAIGNNAMKNYGTTSSSNIVIGSGNDGAETGNQCTYNTILGYSAMPAVTNGKLNIAVGYASLYTNTTGYSNIAIGNNSLQDNTIGVGNIAIGSSAGKGTNGSNKLYIGGFMDGETAKYTGTEALIYGDMANKSLAVNGILTINGEAYIKNSSGATSKVVTEADLRRITYNAPGGGSAYVGVPDVLTLISDARLKNISGDSTAGLKEISQLKVKNFTYKNDKKKTPHVGVIAQDLQKVFPHSVFQDGLSKYFKISREEIFWACVNAIKELNEKFQDLAAKITGLDEKIRILEARNKMNEEKITNLEHQNKLYEERLQAIEFQIAKQLENSTKVQNKLEDAKAE